MFSLVVFMLLLSLWSAVILKLFCILISNNMFVKDS